jgi:acetolactate synthase-1/2/3 large subunit
MHGGDLIARVLKNQGVEFLFTLCGGHISPILSGAKALGIRVVDVRDEANAVFAADAVARLTGVPGVAAVTAGPGCTNTITAIKNAQLAQSPVVLLGGATTTLLKGRGSLQDIDQLALFRPHVKWATSISRVRDLVKTVERALLVSQSGVPGPVFVECPVDLLYEESTVRRLYPFQGNGQKAKSLGQRAMTWYVNWHLNRLFAGSETVRFDERRRVTPKEPSTAQVENTFIALAKAQRPVLVLGSQVVGRPEAVGRIVQAIETLGVPTYLAGMARGLLGIDHPLQRRHQRKKALKEADLVILAGFPCDFRLDYGRAIHPKATLIAVNLSARDLKLNRRPTLAVEADPGQFLEMLATDVEKDGGEWAAWRQLLAQRDAERDEQIAQQATQATEFLNPLALCQAIDDALAEDSILVADGGDFVGTASYITRPRGPLRWLDPGPFGTLGVGGGFALGAKLCRPESEVWILYGDGSCGYTLAEFDTFVRHGVPVIAVVGNDACWMQIYREQVEVLHDDVACVLDRTPYGQVVEGFGAKGLQLERPEDTAAVLAQAKALAAQGHPVLINALIGKTDFRKGSISM